MRLQKKIIFVLHFLIIVFCVTRCSPVRHIRDIEQMVSNTSSTTNPTAADNVFNIPFPVRTPLPTGQPFKADYYIALTGNDSWSGKLAQSNENGSDGPLASFARVQAIIRGLKKSNSFPASGITVAIRGGTYASMKTISFDQSDSGVEGAPVTYRAYPGEQVRLSGGTQIDPALFESVTNSDILARLDPVVRSLVRQVNLGALGITNLGTFAKNFSGGPLVPELYFNDERMTLARWPNLDWKTVSKIISPGSNPSIGETANEGGVIEVLDDRASRWNIAAGVWLHGFWAFDWSDETIQVKAYDSATKQISLAAAAHYGVKQGNPSPRRYYAMNVLEELDSPGEYYIDRSTSILYFYPPASLSGSRMRLSTLSGHIISITGAAHLIFRDLIIEEGLRNGINVLGGTDISILGCEIRNLLQTGINISDASNAPAGRFNRVESCDIHDTGTGGLILSGGERKTLNPARHQAINNHIWRYARHQLTYAPAVLSQGVGNRISHNLIHDAIHQAIALSTSNDSIVENNVIHHVVTESDDSGALYKGRDPSARGNVIRNNFWHHIGKAMGHGNAAIYFDDGDGGDLVVGNIFYKTGEPNAGTFGAIFSHGGHDIQANNNIFISCKRALGSYPWSKLAWGNAIAGADWKTKLLETVNITKSPYITHYPELLGFMTPQPEQLRKNYFQSNLIVNQSLPNSGNWISKSNGLGWETSTDPGFVDAAHGNFNLNANSEVFSRIPGFQPIPMDQMGLYLDDLRSSLPSDPWVD